VGETGAGSGADSASRRRGGAMKRDPLQGLNEDSRLRFRFSLIRGKPAQRD
jgi:hypothetical protein